MKSTTVLLMVIGLSGLAGCSRNVTTVEPMDELGRRAAQENATLVASLRSNVVALLKAWEPRGKAAAGIASVSIEPPYTWDLYVRTGLERLGEDPAAEDYRAVDTPGSDIEAMETVIRYSFHDISSIERVFGDTPFVGSALIEVDVSKRRSKVFKYRPQPPGPPDGFRPARAEEYEAITIIPGFHSGGPVFGSGTKRSLLPVPPIPRAISADLGPQARKMAEAAQKECLAATPETTTRLYTLHFQ